MSLRLGGEKPDSFPWRNSMPVISSGGISQSSIAFFPRPDGCFCERGAPRLIPRACAIHAYIDGFRRESDQSETCREHPQASIPFVPDFGVLDRALSQAPIPTLHQDPR